MRYRLAIPAGRRLINRKGGLFRYPDDVLDSMREILVDIGCQVRSKAAPFFHGDSYFVFNDACDAAEFIIRGLNTGDETPGLRSAP